MHENAVCVGELLKITRFVPRAPTHDRDGREKAERTVAVRANFNLEQGSETRIYFGLLIQPKQNSGRG